MSITDKQENFAKFIHILVYFSIFQNNSFKNLANKLRVQK